MPLTANDIRFFYSGAPSVGAPQTDPNASLGGNRSSTEVPDGQLNNLFDDVSSSEALTGDVEYRAIFVCNTHPSETAYNVRMWISQQPDSRQVKETIAISAAYEGVTDTIQTIPNENTAPQNQTFSSPRNESEAISLGNLGPNQARGVWIRRSVPAQTQTALNVQFVLTVVADVIT